MIKKLHAVYLVIATMLCFYLFLQFYPSNSQNLDTIPQLSDERVEESPFTGQDTIRVNLP